MNITKFVSIILIIFLTIPQSFAEKGLIVLPLPEPGVMVKPSASFSPPKLEGIKIDPSNPFKFDFILNVGDASTVSIEALKEESSKLIKYFLASLTVPEKDLWVNLSPYEKDRIIPTAFGKTEMGRDLLAQDYMLKQITASLIYPKDEIGKKFWKRVYEEAVKKFGGSTESTLSKAEGLTINTFNKVWIVPEKAVVYENAKAGTAYVVESKLKVMLEEDYLALDVSSRAPQGRGDLLKNDKKIASSSSTSRNDTHTIASQIIREIIIPQLTQEVNQGRNFSQLRQIYNSLILAAWYKRKISARGGSAFGGKDSILAQAYINKNKVAGILSSSNALIGDPARIYQQYLQAFKKGVFNYIEDVDMPNGISTPRKYFSGGANLSLNQAMLSIRTAQIMPSFKARFISFSAILSKAPDLTRRRLLTLLPTALVAPITTHAQRNPEGLKLFPADFDRMLFTGQEGSSEIKRVSTLSLTGGDISAEFQPRVSGMDFLTPQQRDKVYHFILPDNLTYKEAWKLIEKIRSLPFANKQMLDEKFRRDMFPIDHNNLTMNDLKRELGALLYWRGVQLFSYSVDINLKEISRRIKFLRSTGIPEFMAKAEIVAINEVLNVIRQYKGNNDDILVESSPNGGIANNHINCIMKSAVTAYFLEQLGIKAQMVDVLLNQISIVPSIRHILLLARLSDGSDFWVEPSKSVEYSHILRNSRLKIKKDKIIDVKNDPFYKRVYVDDWITGLYLGFEYNHANAYNEIGFVQQAFNILNILITTSGRSSHGVPYYVLGIIYINQKRIDDAIRMLRKSIEIDQEDFRAHFLLMPLVFNIDRNESNRLAQKLIEAYEMMFGKGAYRTNRILRPRTLNSLDASIVGSAYYVMASVSQRNNDYQQVVENLIESLKVYPILKHAAFALSLANELKTKGYDIKQLDQLIILASNITNKNDRALISSSNNGGIDLIDFEKSLTIQKATTEEMPNNLLAKSNDDYMNLEGFNFTILDFKLWPTAAVGGEIKKFLGW